jgi:hypothetical protein
MIIVNLKGGLGNQMFQYAFGRALSIDNGAELKLDTSSLSKAKELGHIYRPFDLEDFAIQKTIATDAEATALRYPYGTLSKLKALFTQKILRQNNVGFRPALAILGDNHYLDGYWQSPLFFNHIRETLLGEFTPLTPLSPSGQALYNEITSCPAVSIHIRRGDYVQNPRVLHNYGICSTAYYEEAIKQIGGQVPGAHYFVFSDDIPWVQEHLSFPTTAVTYVHDPTLTAPQELWLMSQCQHNIIANSSFSWWGAWLNQNPGKHVFAPTPWFDRMPYDPTLIPTSWTQLSK